MARPVGTRCGGEAAVGADSSRPPPIYRPPRDDRINLLNPIIRPLRTWIAAARSAGYPLVRHPLSIATGTERLDGIGITPLAHTNLGQQRTHIRFISHLQHAVRT